MSIPTTVEKIFTTNVNIIEITDVIQGGIDGADSKPNFQLGGNTAYIKE